MARRKKDEEVFGPGMEPAMTMRVALDLVLELARLVEHSRNKEEDKKYSDAIYLVQALRNGTYPDPKPKKKRKADDDYS